MRSYWRIIAFVGILFLLVGCASREQSVRTYDEAYDEQMKERYSELDEMFFDKYDSVAEMTRDPLYDEYSGLRMRYGPGASAMPRADQMQNNFVATIDLDNQIIKRGDTEIPYELSDGEVIIPTNDTELQDETLVRMVDLAGQQYDDAVVHNRNTLLKGGWLPVLVLITGITGLLKPEWVWYVEGGYRNKNAEPSNASMSLMKVRSFIAFALAAFLFWALFKQLIL